MRQLRRLILLSALLTAPGSLFAVNYVWFGGAGNASVSTNWIPNGLAGPADTLTVNGGTVNFDAFADGAEIAGLTIANTGSIEADGSRTVRVNGNVSMSGTGTFSSGANKIALEMTASTANATLTCTLAGGLGGSLVLPAAAVNTVFLGPHSWSAANLYLDGGNFDVTLANNYQLTVGGNFRNGAGNFEERSALFVMNGTGTSENDSAFYDFRAASGSSVTCLNFGMQTTGYCTVDGTLNLGGFAMTVGTNLTGTGTLTATGTEAITVTGSFTVATFTGASSTVSLTGATAANLGGAGQNFNNLTINKGAAGTTVTSTAGMTVGGTLTMTQGTWNAGSYTHTIAGSWDSDAFNFTFTAGGSTIVLSAANPTITTKGAGQPFNNLTLNAGGTAGLAAIQVNNDLIIASTANGTLALGTRALTVGRHLTRNASFTAALTATSNQTITVGGNFDLTSFTPSTTTVVFNNAAQVSTISSAGTILNFYNLSCTTAGKTLAFAATSEIAINAAATFTITGASGSQINLVSASPGSQWIISPSATSNVTWAYVQDSDIGNNNNIDATVNCTDGGNNKTSGPFGDWQFSAGTTATWDGSFSTDWRVGANWDLNRLPGVNDSATIPGAVPNNPALTAAVTVANLTVSSGTLSLAGWNLTTSGTLQLDAGGRLRLHGSETLTTTGGRTLNGTVEYYGTAGPYTGLAAGTTYVNLEFTAASTWNLNAGPLTVAGNLTFANGPTVNLNTQNLTLTGSRDRDRHPGGSGGRGDPGRRQLHAQRVHRRHQHGHVRTARPAP